MASAGFFCAELVIGSMWYDPDGHRPEIFRHRVGHHKHGVSLRRRPVAAGNEVAGNWYLPLLMSMGLLLLGGLSAFLMHPQRPFTEIEGHVPTGRMVAAEQGPGVWASAAGYAWEAPLGEGTSRSNGAIRRSKPRLDREGRL